MYSIHKYKYRSALGVRAGLIGLKSLELFTQSVSSGWSLPVGLSSGCTSADSRLWSGMSQDSQHGKWTISSSDDDDGDLPPSGTTTSKPQRPVVSKPSPKLEPATASLEVKPEPANTPVSAPIMGSEARQSAAKNQLNPVKYESSPSVAGKRKKDVSDGLGWALSDSDDETDGKRKCVSNLPKNSTPSPKVKKVKAENERPPSPHGRLYYIDEPEDFYESSDPCLNDIYRFYLNKVTGLDKKYNSGALHIRGDDSWPKSQTKHILLN